MRNEIIYDISTTDAEWKTGEERRLEARAKRAIAEWRLATSGAATLSNLYGNPVPHVKLLQFMAVDSDVNEATKDKRENG